MCVFVSVLVDPFRYRLVWLLHCSLFLFLPVSRGIPHLLIRSPSFPTFSFLLRKKIDSFFLVKQRWPLVNMMMTVQMPVMLLLLLLMETMRRPVSLLRTMLAASAGTGSINGAAAGSTVGTAATVLVLLLRVRMLVLLQVQEMLLLVMVRVRQATSSGQAEMLLLLLVTATGQILLTVDASGH